MGELVAIRCHPAQAGPALRRVWEAGDAALFLPQDAPEASIAAVLASQRPHVLLDLTRAEADGGVDAGAGGGAGGGADAGADGWPGAAPTRLDDPLPLADGVALVVTTSGSTGTPKGVELDHAALHASTQASVARLGCRPGERWVLTLPTHHVAGVQVLLRSWALGTDAEVVDDLAALAASEAQHVSLVPTQLGRLLDAGVDVARFATILLGGARAEPTLLARARAVGARVVVSYGMSETCGGCVYDGVPLDDVEVALDEGRIHLRGPTLFRGYRPATASPDDIDTRPTGRETRAGAGPQPPGPDGAADTPPTGRGTRAGALSQPPHPTSRPDGGLGGGPGEGPGEGLGEGLGRELGRGLVRWFRTGDLGRFDAEGRLEVLGRADDVIISGGENVPVAAVETLLRDAPGVADVAVIGRSDPEWGEVVVALVVALDPTSPPHLERLRAHVRASAPAAYAPRQVVVVDALPRDPMGKIGRAALQRLADG